MKREELINTSSIYEVSTHFGLDTQVFQLGVAEAVAIIPFDSLLYFLHAIGKMYYSLNQANPEELKIEPESIESSGMVMDREKFTQAFLSKLPSDVSESAKTEYAKAFPVYLECIAFIHFAKFPQTDTESPPKDFENTKLPKHVRARYPSRFLQ
jgi:hypothetical protein